MNDEKQLSVHAFVVPVTPFQQNCSIIWCTETKKGAVIEELSTTSLKSDSYYIDNKINKNRERKTFIYL